jgi:hypothetical protein
VHLLTLAVVFVLDALAAILLLPPVATGCRPSDRSRRLSVQKRRLRNRTGSHKMLIVSGDKV